MAYIKSHSNYVLKKKHQNIDDGIIYERDYTTIGGVDNFSAKQIPIYRSGNFLITINDDVPMHKPFADNKWEENEHGTIWSYSDVENASANTDYTDNKIVLKNDYHKLSDFAYFGSCSELVRGSINGILQSFPGELYVSDATLNKLGYSISSITEPYDSYVYVENPYNIDIYTEWITDDNEEKQLKFLAANEHWKNYEIVTPSNEHIVFDVVVESADTICNKEEIEYAKSKNLPIPNPKYKNGSLVYTVTFSSSGLPQNMDIVCLKYDTRLLYFANTQWKKYHIRPNERYINKFYGSLDSFQSLILNPKSEPRYTVSFEVLSEGDYGYISRIETFTFPVGNGGYNVGGSESGLNNYLNKFIGITEFYDNHFSDNLYRMMTHDSIKNFDWSYYTTNNNSDEYVENGEKVSQLIRLFGREFDEIKFYIEGIKHYNQITYDDSNNIPDYFLSDELETDGWDLIQIHPLTLSEYITGCTEEKGNFKSFRKTSGDCFINEFDDFEVSEIRERDNIVIGTDDKPYRLTRLFTQDTKSTFIPYAKARLKYPFGYFYVCDGSEDGSYDDCNGKYAIVPSSSEFDRFRVDSGKTSSDPSKKPKQVIRKRIRKYTDRKAYTTNDINRLFLKRLKLNSRHILRHKGTIQGVEMIFGMFGMISKNFLENYKFTDSFNIDKNEWDYDIKEYTTFSNPILDPYYCCKGMTRLDWYNSTKTIQYNTTDFKNGIYHNYQGLPVAFRNVFFEVDKDNGYEIKECIDSDISEVINYNPIDFSLSYFNNDGERKDTFAYRYRNIYPFFDSNEQYDGNLYYQMDGGWLCNSPYSFDKDNNVVYDESCVYTETINNLNIVDDIQQLVDMPMVNLHNGEIYKVNNTNGEYLLIDGFLYKVYKDYKNNRYISIQVKNNTVTVGMHIFDDKLYVSNVYGECNVNDNEEYTTEETEQTRLYDVTELENGSNVKIYLLWDNGFNKIIAQDEYDIDDSNVVVYENEVQFVNDGVFTPLSGTPTNCFKIIDIVSKETFGVNGWVQLAENDIDYIKVNNIKNYFKGNNPHTGHFHYDGGFAYMNYFANLFNASYNDILFDSRQYDDNFEDEYDYIGQVGFKNLVTDECTKEYPLVEDSKIHFFGNWFDCEQEDPQEHKYKKNDYTTWYDYDAYAKIISAVSQNASACTIIDDTYDDGRFVCSGATPDGYTAQIVNTKVISITINVLGWANCKNEEDRMLTKDVMEEIKYYQDVVMPYVAQMIPSTAILKVNYKLKDDCNIIINVKQ